MYFQNVRDIHIASSFFYIPYYLDGFRYYHIPPECWRVNVMVSKTRYPTIYTLIKLLSNSISLRHIHAIPSGTILGGNIARSPPYKLQRIGYARRFAGADSTTRHRQPPEQMLKFPSGRRAVSSRKKINGRISLPTEPCRTTIRVISSAAARPERQTGDVRAFAVLLQRGWLWYISERERRFWRKQSEPSRTGTSGRCLKRHWLPEEKKIKAI